MFGSRKSTRRNVTVHKYGRSTRPLRLEILERRDQPASLSVLPALHETAIEPSLDLRALIGLTPAIVRNAYGFDLANVANAPGDGFGQTIAIVTAYNHPYIQSDLRAFDSAFGLPSAPNFSVVSATNRTSSEWSLETALDVQWAHAIAPRANLLLVEAGSNSVEDMMNAVDFARNQPGVSVVSMSWGSSEFRGQRQFDRIFSTPMFHSPVSFVAASGDYGAAAGVSWPSSVPSVLAVGGTQLTVDADGNYVSETAWSGSGGGYSQTYTDVATGARAVPDVSYAADPGSGFLVYNSVPDAKGRTGWYRVGGTSAGAPQWAGLVALANEARANEKISAIGNVRTAVKSLTSDAFNDVTTGSNGLPATKGFDLATGAGSPKAAAVISQLSTVPSETRQVVMGPIAPTAAVTLNKKDTATPPPAKDPTQALILAGIAQQNAERAYFIRNATPGQVPTTVNDNNADREIAVPPILVAPVTTFSTWDQAIRNSSGSAEKQGAPVPVLPGEPVPGGGPEGAINVAPANSNTATTSTVSRKQSGTPTDRSSSAVATTTAPNAEAVPANEDPTLMGAAIAFCFLGACYVGIEPKKKENVRTDVVGDNPNGLPKLS